VEASALPRAALDGRVPISASFLRLRSDEQLVSLFRAGSDDAFRVIHERYQARLLAYSRQMLRGSGGDAEDALQDVFVRAFKSLRASNRPILLRAWLYRIAHNRCIDELRRPIPLSTEVEGEERPMIGALTSTQDPAVVAERGETIERLMADVQTLPLPQRSALLMRELQGMSYQELADALGISVPAVKSLLLRARTGLLDLRIARDTACQDIHMDLAAAADRGVRMNARARRHLRECDGCRAYHGELRAVHKGLAALVPIGPLAKLGSLLGIGGGSAGGSSAAGGGAAAAASGAGASAGGAGALGGSAGVLGATGAVKLAAVVATAAVIGSAAPVALQAVRGPSKQQLDFPADAGQLAATTGATVGPSAVAKGGLSSQAGASTGGAAPPNELALAATGPTGTTGATGPTGASATTGVTGSSGTTDITATGGTVAGNEPGTSGPSGTTAVAEASGPPPSDQTGETQSTGSSGPTASEASADTGASGTSATGASGSHGQASTGSTGAP
jgi:RNA polymerase sigma factor (sigma-70 family)